MKTKIKEAGEKTPLAEIYKNLKSGENGLTDAEAIKRSAIYGLNEIAKKKKISGFIKFLSYFKNPLTLVLIVAAVISGLTGEIRNFIIIISMVLLSIILNFYQEHKSNKAAEEIAKKLTVRATALRNNEKKEILTKYVVPGDIILLSAGDIVPGDGRIIQADDFFINEAALTGESFPAEKTVEARGKNSRLVFSGTNVVSGYARFIVTQTGARTEYGKVAGQLMAPEEINAFERGVRDFGYLIIKVIVFIVLAIFLINALRHKNLFDSLIFSLAVAVGITPELLPMIMSVNMAKGSIKMSKKGVIVKRLSAIPDFGSMDILCTDKTGTLTEDKITVVNHLDVFGGRSENVLRLAYINASMETGIKSLLDKAILDFKNIDVGGTKKIDEIPYDFLRKRASIIYDEAGHRQMVMKGAPEEIFKICSDYSVGGKKEKLGATVMKEAIELYEKLSRQGFRVLAVAAKDVADNKTVYQKEEEREMILAGFVAFYDPPKQSAKETLIFMKRHGVEIKILTGDSPLVAQKICQDLNLPIKGVISGEELDINKMSVEAIAVKALEANILARLSPGQKEKVITALRSRGLVVGYLGDGINDAPSLKSADVGISVENAVDVAKETADIILMKKGLKELMDGVLEGRKAFGNTMKYMMMGLSSSFGNMASMIGAVLYLPFFPMTAGQILLNNFLYDTSQFSIPTDNVDEEYLSKPKHWDMKFIRKFMYVFGPISTLFDLITFYLLYAVFNLAAPIFQAGWFIESLATQVFVIYIIRTRKIPFIESRPSKYLLLATVMAVTLGTILAVTPLGRIFGFGSLPPFALLTIFGLVVVYLLLVELVKQFFYRKIYKKGRL